MLEHLGAIRTLSTKAEELDILLWLESGWAIDVRLGKVTREHEDIDVAFAADRHMDYLGLLNGEYVTEGFPKGSCPLRKEGTLDGFQVRCLVKAYCVLSSSLPGFDVTAGMLSGCGYFGRVT